MRRGCDFPAFLVLYLTASYARLLDEGRPFIASILWVVFCHGMQISFAKGLNERDCMTFRMDGCWPWKKRTMNVELLERARVKVENGGLVVLEGRLPDLLAE